MGTVHIVDIENIYNLHRFINIDCMNLINRILTTHPISQNARD